MVDNSFHSNNKSNISVDLRENNEYYTIDPLHNFLVSCNFCNKKFNVLNIDGHIKWEKENKSSSKLPDQENSVLVKSLSHAKDTNYNKDVIDVNTKSIEIDGNKEHEVSADRMKEPGGEDYQRY
mmetsp:Transcript_17051/g.17732  ORF Transcript_17051/g.17732 Transcript_17051/m.17732 type:complete len:124 (+) Transcript_17051:51-422(+)